MTGPVLLDRPAPRVGRLRIDRPDKRNAIDQHVRRGFADGLAELAAEGTVRAVVLGGVGGVFSAGGDLPSMAGLDEARARARMRDVHALCRRLAAAPFPIVTAVEGVAAGAAVGMALLGDHVVAGADARILFPFLSLGLTPDWGQSLTLPRRVGLPAARRLLAGGRAVPAAEALALGLVDELAPPDAAMDAAVAAASRLAALPFDAFRRTRDRLNGGAAALDAELAREEDDQAACLVGSEFAEGFAAFAERRTPDFTRC